MPTDILEWTVPIARWAVWTAQAHQDGQPLAPDVSFVEPMLRRRLSSLAKMSLRVAHDCAHDQSDVRLVYASRHGELARTTTMLGDLADQEGLSPTAFSMSVLNASAGLFSILQHNSAESTAISAGTASFGYGLLEASQQLAARPEQAVLLVYADEPIPEVYGQADSAAFAAHALALLLQSHATRRITCTLSASDAVPSAQAQSCAFLRCLEAGEAGAGFWHGDGARWGWSNAKK